MPPHDDSTFDTLVKPIQLAHVVLRSTNVRGMSCFYRKLLGATTSYENENLAFLSFDEEHHRIAIVGIPNLGDKEPLTAGLDHTAFSFSSLTELLIFYQQRKALGLIPNWCVNHGPTISMYYADPDGNRVEAQTDCFIDARECTAFMESKAFAENPYGVDFDPERLIEKLEAGESEEVLKKRQDIGRRDPPPFI